MRTALLQLTSSDDPAENLEMVRERVQEAARAGAGYILTPEVTNCVSTSRRHQGAVLHHEADDPMLAALREQAAELGIWLTIGSLGLLTDDADGRFANRQFLIDPKGEIAARYDKIHMFDVQVTPEETYRESDGYRPGDRAVVAQTSFGTIGLAICYDLRFPNLFATLARAGANVLTVPAAFSYVTGAAHWHALLRARAIETGCWVLAPAQTGYHSAKQGKQRQTYGHSLVISPWGDVVAEAADTPVTLYFDLDQDKVDQARGRVPSLSHIRAFHDPSAK